MMLTAAMIVALAQPQGEMKTTAEHLKPLEWMIGTWTGEGKFGDMAFTDVVTYEWAHSKTFIKSAYEAKAGDQVMWADNTMLGWDTEKKKLVWFTFGMDGSVGNGDQIDGKEKDTWIAEGKITGPNDAESPFKHSRAVIKRVDADTYTTTIQGKKGDAWETFMSCTYKRKKEKK